MRPSRPIIILGLLIVGLFGAYWVAAAQEGRTLWAPPPIAPPDDVAGPPTKPDPKKALVPKLVLPEAPRQGGLQQAGGVVPTPLPIDPGSGALPGLPQPPPAFPMTEAPRSIPIAKPKEIPNETPRPPQMAEPLMIPLPIPEPTKTLITDPLTKETAAPPSKAKPKSPPTVVTIPAAPVANEPKPAPVPSANEAPKKFVRIRPAVQAPVVPPAPLKKETVWSPPPTIPIAPPVTAGPHLQTPALVVEKRASAPRQPIGATAYQISVRNLSSVPAQQIRIEDELPAGAKLLGAEPVPQMQGTRAVWVLPALLPQGEHVIRLTLQGAAVDEHSQRLSVYVAAGNLSTTAAMTPAPRTENTNPPQTMNTVALRPRVNPDELAIKLVAPPQIAVGKQAVFEIRVTNQSPQPMRGLVLYGLLPEGLNTSEGRTIEGPVPGQLQPGETKTLKMPVNVIKAGRYPVEARVTTGNGHDVSGQTWIDIGADQSLATQVQNAQFSAGRPGDYRIEVTNHSNQLMRNVTVIDQLVEGIDFVAASERGLYQANSRTIHWLIDQLQAGQSIVLMVRVHAANPGQYQHQVQARADGVAETRTNAVMVVSGVANLTLKVIDWPNPLEVGRETVYEIRVGNPGTTPATHVQLHVQFPPGLTARTAHGNARHTLDRQKVVFDPLPSIGPRGEAVYRVSAIAQSAGDQRVRFAVVSEQVRTPILREISTMVAPN